MADSSFLCSTGKKGGINGKEYTVAEIAARIDHTVLAPDAVRQDIEKACAQARSYRFKAVFTNPYWTQLVAELLDGSGVAAGISIAFPLGTVPSRAKALEVEDTLNRAEGKLCAVDMATNISLLKEQRYERLYRGCPGCFRTCRRH